MRIARFSKDFTLVVIGQIISIFGNQILRYALPLHLLNHTGSSALFGTVSAVAFIPMLLLYPIGGIIADRLNKKNIMVILDFVTAMLVSLFCLFVGKIDIVPLIASMMIILYAIQGAYQPAVQASIPVLVKPEYLMQGNSIVNTITSLASMVGPIIGGILFSIFGLTPILYVSVGCFFASAVMEMFIHIPFEKQQKKKNIVITGLSDLKDSFRFLFRGKPILWKVSLVYSTMGLFLVSLVLIALPVLVTQHLGFTPNTANRLYGYAQGVIAAGAVLGGLLAGALSKKLKPTTSPFLLVGGALSILLAGIALQILREPMTIYIILTIGSGLLIALSTLFQIQIMSYIQILTPKVLVGKVISFVICICMCALPLGQFIYGFVFETIGNYTYLPFYMAGFAMIGISVFTRRIFNGIDMLIPNKCEKKNKTQ
jgi:MFS family permease